MMLFALFTTRVKAQQLVRKVRNHIYLEGKHNYLSELACEFRAVTYANIRVFKKWPIIMQRNIVSVKKTTGNPVCWTLALVHVSVHFAELCSSMCSILHTLTQLFQLTFIFKVPSDKIFPASTRTELWIIFLTVLLVYNVQIGWFSTFQK